MASRAGGATAPIGFAQLAGPVVIGLVLRCWNGGEQILGDDEFHAVRAALSMPLGEILVTWRQTDHSLPLTALYRLWLDTGGPLTDGVLRGPPLLASVALLTLAPRLAAPLVGARRATLWAWLLAVSPLLVFYGRMVRSYSLTLALTTIAVLAFARYWTSGQRRFGLLYIGSGAAAIWFHLGAGPLVVSPLLVGAVLLSVPSERRAARPGWTGLAALSAGLVLVGGAGLAPGLPSLLSLIELKRGAPGLDSSIALEVLQLHAGTRWPAAALVFWGLGGAGCAVLWRGGERAMALLLAGGLVGQAAGLAVLAPKLDSPTLALRALLVTLPLSLLAVAAGVDRGVTGLAAATGWRRGPVFTGLAFAAIAASPYLESGLWTTSFRQHDDYLLFSRTRPQLDLAAAPAFYRQLESAPSGALVELPWHPFWGFGHAVPAYQEEHGRAVWVANQERLAADPRLRLRRYVAARPGPLLASDARYAVVHLDLEREETRARGARGRPDETRPQPGVWAALRNAAAGLRETFDAAWGPPDFADRDLAVWDLERIRSQRYAQPGDEPILPSGGKNEP